MIMHLSPTSKLGYLSFNSYTAHTHTYIYIYRKRSNCRPGGRCIFKKGGGNIETYCATLVTNQIFKNDHIILHLHYFTLCRICIYMPYIRVHKLLYFIYYRLIMQCFISIIYCHYYSFIGIPLYSRINQCVSVIPASHAWNGFFHIQITNKQKRLLIYSKLHWNHLMCTVKAYQMQQVNVSKLNDNFNCTFVNQEEVSDFRTCSVAYIGFSRAQTWATLITSFIII